MKSFIKRWNNIMYGQDVDIRERIFCKMTSIGGVVALLALIETMIVSGSVVMSASLLIMVLSVLVSIFLTVQMGRRDIATVLMGLVMCFLVFPGIFFTNGGIFGGATVWFTLNIIYSYLSFKGKRLYIFIGLDIVVESLCFLIGYLHPEFIQPLDGQLNVYLDSFFSVIAVSFAISFLLLFHIRTYSEQRETVEKQKKELEQSNKTQTNFFASMSHELRTPINTIIGLNDMVIRESDSENTLDYSEKIRTASKMLLGLINDILDLSQLETGNMRIAENEYETAGLFREVIDMVRVLIQGKNLELCVDIDESIPQKLFGDRRRIQQVLINLLTNAVKYTESGTVTLIAKSERISGDHINLFLTVKDTGIGIRKESMKDLFNAFRRMDIRKNSKIEGSGLGLSITKKIVDLMGGEITVDSIYTKGSTFSVHVNQKIINSAPMGSVVASMTVSQRSYEKYRQLFEAPEARILVVDDVPVNIYVLQKLLSATKVQIDTAGSGEECLVRTKEKKYHLILLDHMMPDMDGITTLSMIRRQENGLCKETPVIALTANSVSAAQKFYENLGFDAYLEKPIDAMLLERMVRDLLPPDIIEFQRPESVQEEGVIRITRSHKKRKVIVTTDCVSEVPRDLLDQYNMGMMYLYIETKDGRFADTIEIDYNNLSQYMTETSSYAKSVSVSVEEYEQFFAEQLTKADQVIHVSMGKQCGKSYSMAIAAAESFGNVHVIDSGQISGGECMVALFAAELAMSGVSAEEIIEKTNEYAKRIVSRFFMPNATGFYNGGYTNRLVMQICEAFPIHPILHTKKSSMELESFLLGDLNKCRKRFIKQCFRNKKRMEMDTVYITHVALNSKERKKLLEEVGKYVGKENIIIHNASLSVACNSGVGSFSISCCKAKNNRNLYEEEL